MTNLKGSEKQITWASEIRNANIKILERELKEFEGREVSEKCSYEHITSKIKKAIADISNEQTDAKWWIENKNLANAFLSRIKKK